MHPGDNDNESDMERFIRKAKEDPLVPVGFLCTLAVFIAGITTSVRKDRKLSRDLLKARIALSALTIVAANFAFYSHFARHATKPK